MATTFEVFFLGQTGTQIDPTEGNVVSENASALLGLTFGTEADPLFRNIKTLSPVGSPGTDYESNNNTANEQYSVDGHTYTHDAIVVYATTIVYADGTTASSNVIIAQTTTGEIFLVPFIAGSEASQATLEAGPIQSITFDTLVADDGNLLADRLVSNFDGPVDGTNGDDVMPTGYSDADGDQIDGADGNNDAIDGGAGNDLVVGSGGEDDVDGGAGNDIVYGDYLDGSDLGTLLFENTDNVDDAVDVNADDIRAVKLITLANGDLIMLTAERGGSDGIRSYLIDNDPNSSTYGQVTATNNAIAADTGGQDGYREIEDMEAVTTSGGNTYVYSADGERDTIGISQIDASGNLSRLTPVTSSTALDEVQELSQITIDGTDFLLALSGGTSDRLLAYEIETDGSLTLTDTVLDLDGSDENFLSLDLAESQSMLESFTNSAGQSFVMTGGSSGTEEGVSLWTLSNTGTFTFQNARGDNQAGSGDTDPQGNDRGRDLVSPATTGLSDVDAAAFVEIEGETYVIIGSLGDQIAIFRIDPDTVADGTFDLTLVGHFEGVVDQISTLTALTGDHGTHIVIGGQESGLTIMDVIVNADGTVDIVGNTKIEDVGDTELADSESVSVVDGILVSASDDEDGVSVFTTGLNADRPSEDTVVGLAGDDTLYGGQGDDIIFGETGSDIIFGGDGNDTAFGQSENDTLYGDGGQDTLLSGSGNDLVYGDNGQGDGIVVAKVDAVNRISNGTFDDDLAGWTVNNPTGGTAPAFSAGAASFNSGDEASYGDSIEQGFDTNVGQEYTVSLDIKETGAGTASHTFRIDVLDDVGTVIGTFTETVQNGTTQPVSFSFTPTSTANTLVITNTTSSGSTSTDGQVDNVSVLATGPLPQTGGDYSISGGSGDDTIYGQVGDDTLNGEAGNDILVGGIGSDSISGGADNDTISGDFDGTPPAGTDFYYAAPAYVDGVNFAVTVPNSGGGVEADEINIAGDPIVVRFTDNEGIIDGDDTTNEVADDLDQTVQVNGVEYNYAVDYLLDYTDGTNTYTFAMLDLDLNNDGLMNGDVDGGNNHVMLQVVGPVIPADTILTIVPGSLVPVASLSYSTFATLEGQSTSDTLEGGAGNDTITGGAGNDVFVQTRAGGDDVITDFDTDDDDTDGFYNDQLDVSGLQKLDGNPVGVGDVVVSDDGFGNAKLTFPEGETIVLEGVALAQMNTNADHMRPVFPALPWGL